MTSPIKPEAVTMYRCPETGKLYDTEQKAKDSAKRFREKVERAKKKAEADAKERAELEYQRNYVRLNATSSSHALELIVEKAKEFWGIDVMVNNVSPIVKDLPDESVEGKNLISLGRIKIRARGRDTEFYKKVKSTRSGIFEPGVDDVLFSYGFKGFSLGGGPSGEFEVYEMKREVSLIFDDFPLIAERYEQWLRHTGPRAKYKSDLYLAESEALVLSRLDPEYRKLKKMHDYYQSCLQEVDNASSSLLYFNRRTYMEKFRSSTPEYVIPEDLLNQFGDV